MKVEKESHYKNLIKTSKLVNVPVKISPHRTQNTIKGHIQCRELKFTPVEDIIQKSKGLVRHRKL